MPESNESSYQTALLEEMRSNMKLVLEHVSGLEGKMERRFSETQAQNNQRFDTIEAVLKEHSRMHQENLKRWDKNDQRWERTENRLIRIEDRLIRVEDRLSYVEGKLDHVHYRVERHDQQIATLQPK